MIIVDVILVIAVIILGVLYFHKKERDNREQKEYNERLEAIRSEVRAKEAICQHIQQRTEQANNKYNKLIVQYQKAVNNSQDEINYLRAQKQQELNKQFNDKRKVEEDKLSLELELKKQQYNNLVQDINEVMQQANEKKIQIENDVSFQQQKFESILAPLRQYERQQQQRLFYTIQVPEEYRDDINFLLTSVAQKVRHPDIISKLVWSEYIKPYLDDTFKRIEIKAEPGIYKLTNINTNKPYIGKSTDVKKRITDHFKGSVGIRNIADQAVHHAILQDGIWNWTIEVITYCEKDKLSELEKYYIDFFKTQEYGYNKKEGG